MPVPQVPWRWKVTTSAWECFQHHRNASVKPSNKAKLDVIKCRVGCWRMCVLWNFHQVTLCYTSSTMIHVFSYFLMHFLCPNKSKSSQTLPHYNLSALHTTHQGSTLSPSSCKQELESSNHQVGESQPLEHARNAQVIPGHWKTHVQCGKGEDMNSFEKMKANPGQGKPRCTAHAGTRDTSALPPPFLQIITLGKSPLRWHMVVGTGVKQRELCQPPTGRDAFYQPCFTSACFKTQQSSKPACVSWLATSDGKTRHIDRNVAFNGAELNSIKLPLVQLVSTARLTPWLLIGPAKEAGTTVAE